MKKQLLIFIAAFLTAVNTFSLTAFAENDETEPQTTIATETETTTVTEIEEITDTSDPDESVSVDEFYSQSEYLQSQIDEMRQLFEENGYNIDGLTGNVEGLSGEISGLQMSLDDIYTLINTMNTQSVSNNPAALISSQQNSEVTTQSTAPKPKTETKTTTETTTTTVNSVTPNTEPNGYLVESIEKTPEKRDFITVTTRDGHVFYLVIDYEDDEKRVYFLNTVDTADLDKLMGTDTGATEKKQSKTEETETQTVDEAEQDTESVKEPQKKNNMLLYILGGAGVIVFVFLAKKKLSGGKKKFDDEDDDSGNGDDFTEEEPVIYVNEENEEKEEKEDDE